MLRSLLIFQILFAPFTTLSAKDPSTNSEVSLNTPQGEGAEQAPRQEYVTPEGQGSEEQKAQERRDTPEFKKMKKEQRKARKKHRRKVEAASRKKPPKEPKPDKYMYSALKNLASTDAEKVQAKKLISEVEALREHFLSTYRDSKGQYERDQYGRKVINRYKYKQPVQNHFNIGGRYLNLMFAMGISEMLTAIMSKDRMVWDEFAKSLFGANFHLNYLVFETTMTMAQRPTIFSKPLLQYALLGNEGLFKALAPHLVLPLGDFVARYAMDFYNHPKMAQIVAAYSPGSKVIDPDNPKAGLTDDPDIKRKVQNLWRFDIYLDILKDISHGDQIGNRVFGAFRFGIVNSVFQTGKQLILLNPIRGRFNQAIESVLFPFSERATGKIAESVMKKSYKDLSVSIIREININKLAIFLRGGKASASLVRKLVAGHGLFGLAALFIVDGVILAPPTEALRMTTNSLKKVREEEDKMRSAVDWFKWLEEERASYLDPEMAPKDPNLPVHFSQKGTVKAGWLRFFTDYDGNLESDYFKNNIGSWHAYTWRGIYEEANEFMMKLSALLDLGEYDPTPYNQCNEKKSVERHECIKAWYKNIAPRFAAAIKNVGPAKYIEARMHQVHQAYEGYRQGTVMHHVMHHYHLWSGEAEKMISEAKAKENYYLWFARGMKMDDPHFVKNTLHWHVHHMERSWFQNLWDIKIDKSIVFEREKSLYLAKYLVEVLGVKLDYETNRLGGQCEYSLYSCANGEINELSRRVHALYESETAKFVEARASKYTPKDFGYLMALALTMPDTAMNTEQKSVLKKYIKSPFVTGEESSESQEEIEAKRKQEAEQKAWMQSNFADDYVLNNTGGWRPRTEEDKEAVAQSLLVDHLIVPYMSNRDFEPLKDENTKPEMRESLENYFYSMVDDLYKFARGQTDITQDTRKSLVLVTAALRRGAWIRMQLNEELEKLNAEYKHVIDRAARTKGTIVGAFANSVLNTLTFGAFEKTEAIMSQLSTKSKMVLHSLLNMVPVVGPTASLAAYIAPYFAKTQDTVFDWDGFNYGYFLYYPNMSFSDLFKWMPTIWGFFPSFEGDLIDDNGRHQKILTTSYSALPYSLIGVFNHEMYFITQQIDSLLRLVTDIAPQKVKGSPKIFNHVDQKWLDMNRPEIAESLYIPMSAINLTIERLKDTNATESQLTPEFKRSIAIVYSLTKYYEDKYAKLIPKELPTQEEFQRLPEDMQNTIIFYTYYGKHREVLASMLSKIWPSYESETFDLTTEQGFQEWKHSVEYLHLLLKKGLYETMLDLYNSLGEKVDGKRETQIRHALGTDRLGIALATMNIFYPPKVSSLLKTLGNQMIFINNQKLLEARFGCYLLDEKLCQDGKIPSH